MTTSTTTLFNNTLSRRGPCVASPELVTHVVETVGVVSYIITETENNMNWLELSVMDLVVTLPSMVKSMKISSILSYKLKASLSQSVMLSIFGSKLSPGTFCTWLNCSSFAIFIKWV